MSIWQIYVWLGVAGCAIVCLIAIAIAIAKLAKAIFTIGAELKKMNAKLESVEAVNKDELTKSTDRQENDFEAIEAAISNFEKLKRIDLSSSQGERTK
jgi:hypothetical protein